MRGLTLVNSGWVRHGSTVASGSRFAFPTVKDAIMDGMQEGPVGWRGEFG